MSANRSVVKVFGGLAIVLGGTGGYLAYKQSSGGAAHSNAAVIMPRAAAASGGGGGAAAQAGAQFPLVLPPPPRGRGKAAPVDPALVDEFHAKCAEAAALGVPSPGEVRCYGGYLASLNYERRIPNWVLETVRAAATTTTTAGDNSSTTSDDDDVSRKHSAFYADPSVPEPFRVAHADYDGARGLSRGHLAPAQLHKASQVEMNATFNMNANIVPQDMTCNAVDWLRLETLVRRVGKAVTADDKGRLLVVTGPAFVPHNVRVERRGPEGHPSTTAVPGTAAAGPATRRVVQYEVIGKAGVAVPTHLFKVLLAEKQRAGGGVAYEAAAFLLPNEAIPVERPLTAYQVNPRELEKLTGLRFFPDLPTSVAALPDLCRSHKCEAKGSALFEKYRLVAQLRAANTIPELQRTYTAMQTAGGKALDGAVVKEYQHRVEELAAEAVGPMDWAERSNKK